MIDKYLVDEICTSCGQQTQITINNLPRTFYINFRVSHKSHLDALRKVYLRNFEIIKNKKYYLKGIIQYSEQLEHFRTCRTIQTSDSERWWLLDHTATELRGSLPREITNPKDTFVISTVKY